jgi:hypothetical protein
MRLLTNNVVKFGLDVDLLGIPFQNMVIDNHETKIDLVFI